MDGQRISTVLLTIIFFIKFVKWSNRIKLLFWQKESPKNINKIWNTDKINSNIKNNRYYITCDLNSRIMY